MTPVVLKSFFPEIFLSFCILFQLLFNTYSINNQKHNFPLLSKEVSSQTFFILTSVLILLVNLRIEGFLNNFIFLNDEGVRQAKIFFFFICIGCLPIILRSFILQTLNFTEFLSLFLLSIFSLMLLMSSYDFLSFFLTLEMQSLCFYVLASLRRNSSFSTDAGLKYFISGSFISGFFLLGCSFVYGVLGTLNLNHIGVLLFFPLDSIELRCILNIGLILITSILLFKMTCAPFHFWSPDVYEGAPLSATVIFSIIPKIPMIFFFIKWVSVLGSAFGDLSPILMISGLLSIFIGTFFGLSQKRVKRLIIFSSIAQVGFMICGLSLNTPESFVFVYFFLFIYLITSILIWGHITIFYSFQRKTSEFSNLVLTPLFLTSFSSLSKFNGVLSFSFLIILFSIAGIPVLTGFLSKVFVVSEILKSSQVLFGVLLMLISSISVFYYIRIIKVIYFEPNVFSVQDKEGFQITYSDLDIIFFISAILLFFLVILFVKPSSLFLICEYIVFSSSGI